MCPERSSVGSAVLTVALLPKRKERELEGRGEGREGKGSGGRGGRDPHLPFYSGDSLVVWIGGRTARGRKGSRSLAAQPPFVCFF